MTSQVEAQPLPLRVRVGLRQLPDPAAARAIRVEAHFTQREVAAELEVDRVTVARWEAGRRRPRGSLAERYGALLRTLASGI